MQKLREKLESPSYNHALAYQNIREALEIVMRWIDDYCETGPENDFERVEKIANAAMEYTPPAQPAVQDADGENKAVRSFLMLYGQPGLTVGQMKKHMTMSGFKAWPAWVETEPHGAHLTKAGAQLWIRHLFALEATPPAPQPVPVKTYHDGKPWPVAPKPWVGLTDEDKLHIEIMGGKSDVTLAEMVEDKLKERNV
jgi:hypothetical protein